MKQLVVGEQRRGMSQVVFMSISGRVQNDSQVSNAASQQESKCRRRSRYEGWEVAELCLEHGPETPLGLQVELSSMSMGEIDPEDLGWESALGASEWWIQSQNWVMSPEGRMGMKDECSRATPLGNSKSERSTSLQKPLSWPVQPFQGEAFQDILDP